MFTPFGNPISWFHAEFSVVNNKYHALIFPCEAHHEMSWLCGAVSIVEPARETTLRATLAGLPNATNTAIASIAVRPTPPAQ
jgi:hypothetical protein